METDLATVCGCRCSQVIHRDWCRRLWENEAAELNMAAVRMRVKIRLPGRSRHEAVKQHPDYIPTPQPYSRPHRCWWMIMWGIHAYQTSLIDSMTTGQSASTSPNPSPTPAHLLHNLQNLCIHSNLTAHSPPHCTLSKTMKPHCTLSRITEPPTRLLLVLFHH